MSFLSTNNSFAAFQDITFDFHINDSSTDLDFSGYDASGATYTVRMDGSFTQQSFGDDLTDYTGTVTNLEIIVNGGQILTSFGLSVSVQALVATNFGSQLLQADGLLDGPTQIFSDLGEDVLHGGTGRDELDAGERNDVLYGNAGNDKLYAGSGADKLYGGAGRDKLYGQGGKDKLFGGNGDDILRGGNGNDTLSGNSGNDLLSGGAGADRLIGHDGDDEMSGGSGADTFIFLGLAGTNRITDFELGVDKLEFRPANQDLFYSNVEDGMLIEWDLGSVLVEDVNVNEYFLS